MVYLIEMSTMFMFYGKFSGEYQQGNNFRDERQEQ